MILRSLKRLNIGALVGTFDNKMPKELGDLTFDLDVDPALLDKYKKLNLRYSGASAAEYLTKALLEYFFENVNDPNMDYSVLEQVLSESGLTRVAILNAHGANKDGYWVYGPKGPSAPVHPNKINKWVSDINSKNSRARNKYGALLIGCCNKTPLDLDCNDIPTFYPKGSFGPENKHKTCLVRN